MRLSIKKIILLLLICISFSSKSIIVENYSINCLKKYVSKDTLIIFDVDNTLIKPTTDIGSDQWFFEFVNVISSKGVEVRKAINKILPLYNWLQHVIQIEAVEKDSVDLVNVFQKNNIKNIALTIRSFELEGITIKQLKSIGIDFSKSWNHDQFYINIFNEKKGLFSSGIIFCNGNDKGEVFKAFIEKIKYVPKKIVFIDDKLKYLQSMEKIAEKMNIGFVGIKYAYLDNVVSNFKLQSFDLQFIDKIIS